MTQTARIFVGCAPNHEDAESQAVLEWSIRKHASIPIDITWMKLRHEGPFSGWRTDAWPTPFSAFRWAVPELAGFKGRAIYMDSDVMVLGDIAELLNQSLAPGKAIAAKSANRLCVSLWDCEAVRPHMTALKKLRGMLDNHKAMSSRFRGLARLVQPFVGGEWNNLDGEPSRLPVKALHYTSMPHQPHIPYATARLARAGRKHWFDGTPTKHWNSAVPKLFHGLLTEAEESGYTVDRYCQDEPFGPYKKRHLGSLKGAVPGWGKR
jgi:hypothetical protein